MTYYPIHHKFQRWEGFFFIFQTFELIPTLSAKENIMLPAEVAGRNFDRGSLATPILINIALDEAQASIRAARFAPELDPIERYTLLRDAIARLKRQNLNIRKVCHLLFINES